MRTEKEKMLAGELYDPLDPELVRARERARDLCQDLNATRERDQQARRRILTALFGKGGVSVWLRPHSSATTGRTSCWASGSSATATASSSTCAWWRSVLRAPAGDRLRRRGRAHQRDGGQVLAVRP
jgi:hypothetical protein